MTQTYKVNLTITPLQKVILPVPSSKVIKYLIPNSQYLPSLKHLVSSRDKFKPIFILNLGVNGKKIIDKLREVNRDKQ